MKGFTEVTEEQAREFVRNYPRKLEWDCTGICEPPLGSYNDFTYGFWPDSMVIKVIMDEPKEYYIRNDLIKE
jgi:hypothetical protein